MNDLPEQLETYFHDTATAVDVRPDIDGVVEDAAALKATTAPRASTNVRLLAVASVLAVIAVGVAIAGLGQSQQVDAVDDVVNGGAPPGRIIARCVHNIPQPVGDDISLATVVEICALTPDGELLGRLPTPALAVEVGAERISPDSTQLVYRTQPTLDGERTALVVDIASGESISEWDLAANEYTGDVRWSADGESLLFRTAEEVVVQPVDGGEPTRYFIDDQPDEFTAGVPLMSPDGRWIAVRDDTALFVVDTTTGDLRTLDGFNPSSYTWSANSVLAVISDEGESGAELLLVDPLSLETTSILDVGNVTSTPAWSPDGTQLFVTGDGISWFVDPSAEAAKRVIRTVTYGDALINPSWAPDGSWVVAQTTHTNNAGPTPHTLVIVDSSTGEIRPIIQDPLAVGSLGAAQPSWVPGDWEWQNKATTWPSELPPLELDD